MFSDFNRTQSDKEGVKLLSVKTTSPETGECFLCVCICLPLWAQRRTVLGCHFQYQNHFQLLPGQSHCKQFLSSANPRLGACRAAVQLLCVWYECLMENCFFKSLMVSDPRAGTSRSHCDHDIYQLDLATQEGLRTGNMPGTKRFVSRCCT